jgi:tetratricopeptide (TPR) repeat protein
MDLPSAQSPSATTSGVSAVKSPQRRPWSAWHIILLLLAGVFGPATAVQIPYEIGRWRLAQAIQLRGEGQTDAAHQKLEAAIAWFPKSMELLLTRAEWRLEDGQRDEALAECDRMLEVVGGTYESLLLHGQFLQTAGEFPRAVEDWKKIAKLSELSGKPNRATALNGLAYAQALAESQLDDALTNVNAALEVEPNSPAILDTRGFIYYLQAKGLAEDEKNEVLIKGLKDLDVAVKTMDGILATTHPVATPSENPEPVKQAYNALPKTLRDMANSDANAQRSSAVMHYHRALILESLSRKKEAEAERAVVRRLIGREPDKTLF